MKTFLLALAALTTSCASLDSGHRQIAGDLSPVLNRGTVRMLQQIKAANDYEQSYETAQAYALMNDEPRVCKNTSEISRGLPPPPKTVVLTFDDGPSPLNTPEVLRILKIYNIKATFFMQGSKAQKYPDMIQQVSEQGHIIANHSYTHPIFPRLQQTEQAQEIIDTDRVLNSYMSKQSIKLFRFPYGSSTCYAIDYVKKTMQYNGSLGWHIDTCDWAYQKTGVVTSPTALKNCEIKPENTSNYHDHVMALIRHFNGGIILMHETNDRTVVTLEDIIKTLLAEGFAFSNMDAPNMQTYIKQGVPPPFLGPVDSTTTDPTDQ